jgi:hypothetical protein
MLILCLSFTRRSENVCSQLIETGDPEVDSTESAWGGQGPADRMGVASGGQGAADSLQAVWGYSGVVRRCVPFYYTGGQVGNVI